jgi:hypothetical protein
MERGHGTILERKGETFTGAPGTVTLRQRAAGARSLIPRLNTRPPATPQSSMTSRLVRAAPSWRIR